MFAIKQLFKFGWEQALSCVFPVVIFGALALTSVVHFPWLPRYDWLLLICVVMQIVMVVSGLETLDELKVITLFHIIGIALEIFKVHMGSWSYPNPGYATVFHVPLFSGFMYASVASYIVQAWRRLDIDVLNWPPFALVTGLSVAIYANFFTHHFWYDLRWLLFGLVVLVFWRSAIAYRVGRKCTGCRSCCRLPSSDSLSGLLKISRPFSMRGNIRIRSGRGTWWKSVKLVRGCYLLL